MRSLASISESSKPDNMQANTAEVDTLLFDIDDTLYRVSSGFSDHRNGPVVEQFMIDELGFETAAEAKELRDEYFRRYHSTLVGLKAATAEGKLPRPFDQASLGAYWARHCDYSTYLAPDPELIADLLSLKNDAGMRMAVFTNSPRAYGLKCLTAMGLDGVFPEENIFAVEDVLPECKPQPEAFSKVLRALGAEPQRTVMFEDSMKNVRACRELGMRTVLIDETMGEGSGGEARLLGDVAQREDPAVDVALEHIGQLRSRVPELWSQRIQIAGE